MRKERCSGWGVGRHQTDLVNETDIVGPGNDRFVQEIVQMHVEIQGRMQEDAALLPDRVS